MFSFFGLLSLLRFQTTKKISNLLLSALYFGFMGATRLQDLILIFPAIVFMYTFGLKMMTVLNNKQRIKDFLRERDRLSMELGANLVPVG